MFKYFQSWSESKNPYFAHDPYNIFLITVYNFMHFEKILILRITRIAHFPSKKELKYRTDE